MISTFSISYYLLGFILFVSCVAHYPSKPEAVQTKIVDDDELDGHVTLYLYHSLEPSDSPPVYTKRGTITINSARNEATYMDENLLSVSDAEMLKSLAASNDVYRIKLLNSKLEEVGSNSVFSFYKSLWYL